MSAHTPGPWPVPHFATGHGCECRYILAGEHMGGIAEVYIDNGKKVGDGGNDCPPTEEAKANARLIAAAPDLLAALRLARDVVAESCEMREGYGAFHGGDPRDFTPDPECSTEEERAAHAAAVAKAETDESARNLEPSHRWVMPNEPMPEGGVATIKMGMARHVEVPMFGLGTYRDREAEAVLRAVDDAIAKAEGK